MSRMRLPAAPAPMAAEAQSKPSSTLCTTGAVSGSMATGPLPLEDRRVGHGPRAGGGGGERPGDERGGGEAGDAV